MSRDLQRERLLAKLYSREGSAAVARDYVDATSGEVLHITPGEWELLQYDRAHSSSSAIPSLQPMPDTGAGADDDGPAEGRAAAVDENNVDENPADENNVDENPADEDQPAEPSRPRRPSRRALTIGAALAVAGCLVGVALAVGIGHLQPGLFGFGGRSSAPAPINEIQAVFTSGNFASSDPGSPASIGFDPDSFRIVGDDVVYDRTEQVFAARREDGEYCLVLISGAARVAETCATAQGIGSNGLTMNDTTREDDGSLLTFAARWNRNGQITWKLVETSH